jgi:hypothetical protein
MSYSELLTASIDKTVISYIEKIVIRYSLNKEELVSLWKGAEGVGGGADETPKELLSLSKNELVELCKSKNLKFGGTKNDLIQRLVTAEKQSKTQPLITAVPVVAPKLISKVDPIALHRNKFGNFEHPETGFIFHEKTEKVFGKQNPDGSIASLTLDDINICNKYKFGFDIPVNLQQQDDKVELAELDEDEEIEVEVEEEEEEDEDEEEVEVELEIDEDD